MAAGLSSSQREFRLPSGLESRGRRQRDGVLRPATAQDELRALRDFRVCLRPESFLHLMLARTIVRLGDLDRVDVRDVERLDGADQAALEIEYRELNGYPPSGVSRPRTEEP